VELFISWKVMAFYTNSWKIIVNLFTLKIDSMFYDFDQHSAFLHFVESS